MSAQAPATPAAGGRPQSLRAEAAELLTLSAPVVAARLGVMTMGLSDAIVVGRYSAQELGFHALGWAPTSVVMTVAIGLLMGVQVMTARAVGEGRRREAGAVLRRGLVYGFWIGVLSMAVLGGLGPLGLANIGLEPELARGAGRAAAVFALSLPFYVLACVGSFWLEGLARPMPAMWLMWAANLVNLALLLWWVPGDSPLPISGAVAAAWATFGARGFLLAGLAVYILRMREARALGVFVRPPRERGLEIQQRRVGYGAGASNFFEVAAFASMNVIAGWISGLAVAAWAVVLNVTALIFMVPLGLSAGASVLVGRAYGARDARGVVRAGLVGFGVATVFGALVSLAIWPSARLVIGAYTSEAAVIALAAPALVLACLFFLADGLQVVAAHALRARDDVLVPTITHLASYTLVMMPLGWWLAIPMKLGINGLALAIAGASLMAAVLLLGRFWLLSRRPL
jgi:multidrug resistance protein, MATE family